jgi:tRNA dimethylallyltransferase
LKPLLVILGPTASGKTKLAVQVCRQINGELISIDSRQIYRDMNIGTGKDLHEYTVGHSSIPYHLIDIRNAGDQYNVNDFHQDLAAAYGDIDQRGLTAVACGGTGFYIHSVLTGHAFASVPVNDPLRLTLLAQSREELLKRFSEYDTPYANLADTSTHKRLIRAIEISEYLIGNPEAGQGRNLSFERPKAVIYGLNPNVDLRRERITERLHTRLENGLIEEVQSLLDVGLTPDQLMYYGLEYKYVTLYLTGQIPLEEMIRRLETEIHRFAKRQMTFFRKMEKDGIPINWLEPAQEIGEHIQFIVSHYEEAIS